MDNIKKSISNKNFTGFTKNLSEGNNSYTYMILVIGAMFTILITLYFALPKGFNKNLGQSTFLSVTFLYFLFTFVKFYNTFTRKDINITTNYYSIFYIFGGLLISGGLIYGIINSLQIINYEQTTATNQTLINYIIIMIMIVITFLTFLYEKIKTDNYFKNMPEILQYINNERFKYTMLFILFTLSFFGILIYNPYNLLEKYGGASIFIVTFFLIVLFSMVYISNYFLHNPEYADYFTNIPGVLFIIKMLSLLFGLVISGVFLYWALKSLGIFEQNSEISNNITKIIVNIIMVSGLLGVFYKLIDLGGYIRNSPFIKLLTSTLLYIPCLFVNIWNMLIADTKTTKFSEIILLIISLGLFLGYFVVNYFIYPKSVKAYYDIMLGGEQILNEPIPTDKTTNIAGYQDLNGDDKFSYEHAISFWTYIDALPPNTNSSYAKPTSILSYGNNPSIKYDAISNSLIITVPANNETPMSVLNITKNIEKKIKMANEENVNDIEKDISNTIDLVKIIPSTPDLDNQGNKIICKITDFKLQKWNNIVINCSGETLDIFYNGELIKSTKNTIPYMKYDMLVVGTDNGIIGKIANIMYYKSALDYLTINRLYSSFKSKTPPIK
jgi:hypothetical protein